MTKGKLIGALAALVLVVGAGNAIGGTEVSTDATTHALVATGSISQDSAMGAAGEAAEEALASVAEIGSKAKAKVEAEAKAEKEVAEAEAKAKADAEAKAQAQQKAQQERAQRESAATAPAATPQASQENAARDSGGGGGGSAAPVPPSGGGKVYIAASGEGKTYHSRPTCGTMKKSIEISLSEAQSRGLPPCKNCH